MESATGNSSLRSSSSRPILLVWFLNLSLPVLAAAALGAVFLLRPRPTPFGWALVSVHAITLLSALAAPLRAQLPHLCLAVHTALAWAAMSGSALAFLAFGFRDDDHILRLLGSTRERRELLAYLERLLVVFMFLVQVMALAEMMEREQAEPEAGVKAVDEKVMRSSRGKNVHWDNHGFRKVTDEPTMEVDESLVLIP